jgi:stage V sporulation protein D (sporulation-specific penicillin-binding protein)
MRSKFILRTRILAGSFAFIALLLIVRLYFVQIVHGGDYVQDATAQYTEANPDTVDRGSIFFTAKDGELVSAAIMQNGWRIALQPKNITDAAKVYAQLNAITPIDHDRFFSSVVKTTDPYEEVAFQVSDDSADKIRALNIPGVLLVADQWRFYPGGGLAAQALGFIGYSGTSTLKVGVYGLEKQWQNTLAQSGSGLYVNPFAEIFANLESAVSSDPSAHEGSIVTSIEPSVQDQLEKTLDDVMTTYTPKGAGGIVMDPKTGEIYAIGARPSFDPNTYNTVSNEAVFSDPLVEGRYELGSIMKPLTMAAGIDSGAITEDTTYDDTGCITVSTYKVCNYDLKARGVIPMQQILSQSLNVGASWVATKMGYPTFTKYMNAYGFGEKTGVDLPNEVTGDLSNLGHGTESAVNYDTASFGQGISVSPIEMIRALSALANGGVLPNPHVVTGIKYESGITRSIDPGQGPRVLSATTTDTVTNMLITVFDKGLLNGALKEDHYSFAAKTGTAQIPKPGGGYYPDGTYIHSFFGYFPAHNPRFIIFLFAIEPHGQQYASATLAHPFIDIANFLINYYNIPPDR